MRIAVATKLLTERGARREAGDKALIALEGFTGLTALAGGALLMARPDGSLLQMAPSALVALASNSPFPDFFVPGMALAGGVGGGMLGAALLLARRRPYAHELAMASGAALIVFELVEYGAIGFMPLQAFEGVVGAVVLGLAARRRWAEAHAHATRHTLDQASHYYAAVGGQIDHRVVTGSQQTRHRKESAMATLTGMTHIGPEAARQPRHHLWMTILGLALAAHGAIHLLGFVVDWRLATVQDMPYRATILAGQLSLNATGMHVLGLLWLAAALGFVAVGLGLAWRGRPWRAPLAAVALFSLVVCILGWPDSAFGAVIDVAVLAILFAGQGAMVRRHRQA